jgi:predicted metal-dependent hydrolase
MAAKTYTIEGIGEVTVYKRRGTHKMNLRIVGGQIRVTQPTWLPYATGVQFARSNTTWIESQRQKQPSIVLENGTNIGKSYTLVFDHDIKLRTRLTDTHIIIYMPRGVTAADESAQNIAKTAVKRALKKEAEAKLPERLAFVAQKYGFNYKSVHCKSMRTRWGSCNNNKEITLNIFLMMVPWELIDYVLVHELAHTQHLHHGPDFWGTVEAVMPDYKERRKQLKIIQGSIAHLQ